MQRLKNGASTLRQSDAKVDVNSYSLQCLLQQKTNNRALDAYFLVWYIKYK